MLVGSLIDILSYTPFSSRKMKKISQMIRASDSIILIYWHLLWKFPANFKKKWKKISWPKCRVFSTVLNWTWYKKTFFSPVKHLTFILFTTAWKWLSKGFTWYLQFQQCTLNDRFICISMKFSNVIF